MADRLKVEYDRVDALLARIEDLASTMLARSDEVSSAVASAESSERAVGSPVGNQLSHLRSRWDRELELTAQDASALASTVRQAIAALRATDDAADQEMRGAQQ